MGVKGKSVESQGSVHILMLVPDPTTHPKPLRSTCLPAITPLHPCDADCGEVASKNDVEWQYFPLSVRDRRDWGNLSTRQASFASSASLNCSISLKPSPPAYLGLVKVFQESQAIFLKFGLTSHQNLVRTDWICRHSEIGILKHDMA